jgi:hypothetical protein
MAWEGSTDRGKKVLKGIRRESLGRWQTEVERRWDNKVYKL